MEEKNYEKAKEALTLWIQSDTTRWEAYFDRARCETELQEWPEALADYEIAFAKHPTAETCAGLGKGYAGTDLSDKAKAYLNRAIGMDSSFAAAYLHLGEIYLTEEDYEEALAYLLKAQSLSKQPTEAVQLALMETYFELENDLECEEIIRQLKSGKPLKTRVYEFSGRLLLRQKAYQAALKEFNTALHLDSSNFIARLYRAETYKGMERYAEEIVDRTKIIAQMQEMDSTNTEYLIGQSYFFRGTAYSNAGNYPAALADYAQSLKIAGDKPGTYLNRAVTKIRQQNLSGALADYRKALALEPSIKDLFTEYVAGDSLRFQPFLAYCQKQGIFIQTPKQKHL
jgi:tetratricopeptide (TPR) repeat protein